MYAVANYKMNGDKEFFLSQVQELNKIDTKDTKIVLCPPFIYLPFFKVNERISLGAQDVANAMKGRSTGQVSATMLKEFDAEYVIIGHSERRSNGETNTQIVDKVKCALELGLIPIICVGELNKNSGNDEIFEQVDAVLKNIDHSSKIIFAYEPVWAIGSGDIPTTEEVKNVIDNIKSRAKEMNFDIEVLYGGSVDEKNFTTFSKAGADGFLLGGITLKTERFIELIKGMDNE
ncbi:MAG: triose-phosphate isomerase [Clostridia bacterium]|nr:triose-phosphate isomerase [Clostridia bacterium]